MKLSMFTLLLLGSLQAYGANAFIEIHCESKSGNIYRMGMEAGTCGGNKFKMSTQKSNPNRTETIINAESTCENEIKFVVFGDIQTGMVSFLTPWLANKNTSAQFALTSIPETFRVASEEWTEWDGAKIPTRKLRFDGWMTRRTVNKDMIYNPEVLSKSQKEQVNCRAEEFLDALDESFN